MGFLAPSAPEIPKPPPIARTPIGDIKALAANDARLALLSRGPKVDRSSLVIDPAVPTPDGGGGVNTY